MPSTSKSQQRLMGVAYAVKKGDMQISDVDVDYRDKVKDLISGMTLKQLKGFAETKHEGLPEVVENISIDSVGGIGPVKLPTSTENGSGDVPAGQGDAEEEYRKKKRKMKHLKTFESFLRNDFVNEEYIELPSLDVPSTDLIEAFKEWYKATADNWEDFKNDMSEDSVDEAAKNAQMEILAHLSNEMNAIIKDRKFKVRADFR
jgi:hypothetical protein